MPPLETAEAEKGSIDDKGLAETLEHLFNVSVDLILFTFQDGWENDGRYLDSLLQQKEEGHRRLMALLLPGAIPQAALRQLDHIRRLDRQTMDRFVACRERTRSRLLRIRPGRKALQTYRRVVGADGGTSKKVGLLG
jgi:hypothetical protein